MVGDSSDTVVSVDLAIRVANVSVLLGCVWWLTKVIVPVGLSIRDSLRDTAKALEEVKTSLHDHEARLRALEWTGHDRRGKA